MAYFIANPNVGFNIDNIDLNFYVRNYDDDTLYKGINYVIQGRTFPDVFEVSAYNGQLYALDFGGFGITQNTQGAITSGTFTGILEYSYSLGDGMWFIGDISLSAVSIYNAVNTASNSDDLSLFASALAGNDTFSLSNLSDVIRGYAGDDVFMAWAATTISMAVPVTIPLRAV